MPQRSATKTKALATALALFNEEGEGSVSAVDIASAMGISPGNLYYHYKGKDEIIVALFEGFEEEIRQVLSAPINAPLNMADNWVYLYIIFEEIFDFRFFYRNQSELIGRIPDLRTRFSSILGLKERTVFSLLSKLHNDGFLIFDEGEKQALAGRVAQHFTFWLQYHDLRFGTAPPKALIDQGVFMTLVQITPYWKDEKGYATLLQEFADDKV